MFRKQAFTVTIGDYATAIVLHEGSKVNKKLLINSISEEHKPQLERLFNSHKLAPIYILLDTIDQNYRRKLYPMVNVFDLKTLIKKDQKKEVSYDSEEIIENYITKKNKELKKWECISVSSSRSHEINSWKNFLLKMPNRIVGIYMLPLETGLLLNKVEDNTKDTKNQPKKKEKDIISFITQNKVSGTRQVVFSNDIIVFTRVVNYDFEDEKFADRFLQDLFRTHEYLKRIFPDMVIGDVEFINILPKEVIDKIESRKDNNLKFTNLTPYEAALKAKCPDLIPKNSKFSDILIANIFATSRKKILKFLTPQIKLLENLHLVTRIFFITNVILPLVFLSFLGYLFFYNNKIDKEITTIMQKKLGVEESFQKVKSSILDDKDIENLQIDKIVDFGKVNETLEKNNIDIFKIFGKLALIKKHGVIANSFSYFLVNYNPKSDKFPTPQVRFIVSGNITVSSGDVEELFAKFDGLVADTKNAFKDYNVKYADLPRDIDFSKKYYTFPINLEISSR